MKNFNFNFKSIVQSMAREMDERVRRLKGASIQHPISIHSASIEHPLQSGGNQVASRYLARIWKYAAMLLMVLTLGVGQMWADAGYNGESYVYLKVNGTTSYYKVSNASWSTGVDMVGSDGGTLSEQTFGSILDLQVAGGAVGGWTNTNGSVTTLSGTLYYAVTTTSSAPSSWTNFGSIAATGKYNGGNNCYYYKNDGSTNITPHTPGDYYLHIKIVDGDSNERTSSVAFTVPTFTVAGDNTNIFGTSWDAANTANDMTWSEGTTYTLTKTNVVLNSTNNCKVVLNHDWDAGAYPASNKAFNVDEGIYDVTFAFNAATQAVSVTPTNLKYSLVGDFNSWNVGSNPFINGVAEADLAVGDYLFKVRYGGTYYGAHDEGAKMSASAQWALESPGKDITLKVTIAGTYKFVWDATNSILIVVFPGDESKPTLTKGKYIYYDSESGNENIWNRATYIARFVFQDYATGEEQDTEDCLVANALEDSVFYVLVPNIDDLGRIKMQRINPSSTSEVWNYSGIAHAISRDNAGQNCLVKTDGEQSWWDTWVPVWKTYCPPMTAGTLADNGTTKISWQDVGNDGSTLGKAILVKTGTNLLLTASSTSAVSDGNMTAYYDFKVNSESQQSTSSNTLSYEAGTNNTTYTVTVEPYNYYNSTSGTKYTSVAAKYYKALNTYTVAHTLSNVTCSAGRTSTDAAAYYQPYTATFAASTGYNLPATITVKFGSTTKTVGTDYTWTQATGVLSIPANKIDGAVTVIVSGVAKTYTVNLNENGGTAGSVTSVTATYNAYPADHVFSDLLEAGARPTKSDYYLDGWYTGTGGTGEKLIDGPTAYLAYGTGYLNEYTDASGNWIYDNDKTLYARWKANSSDDNYTFTYGSGTRYDASTWTVVALDTATNHMWQKTGFTMPDPTSKTFYVGFEEDFYRDHYLGWATPTKAQSAEVNLSSLRLAPGTQAIGTATGATGSLVIWSNSAEDNLYVGFQPDGYGITYYSDTKPFTETDAANNLWETDPITLVANDVSGSFQVKLATSSSYTACALSASEDKDDLDGRNGERPDLATGQRGKFRMWANSSTSNFGLDFMPVYSVSFNMKGHGSAIDPYPSIDHGALIGAPPAPSQTGYTFDGWYKDEDCTEEWDFATDVVTENTTLYAKWIPETLTLTGTYWTADGASAWSPACVPTIEHDVIIPKDKYCRVTTNKAQCKSVKIDNSDPSQKARLIIEERGALLVKEGITAKHSAEGEYEATNEEDLWIRTGYGYNSGLICGNRSTSTGAEYIFHSKVYKYSTYYVNQYVGIPFAKMDPFDWYGVNIFEYNPAKDDWMTPSNDSLKSFTCYNIISKSSEYNYTTFYSEGKLNLPGVNDDKDGEGLEYRKKVLRCGWRADDKGETIDANKAYQDFMFANSWTAPISIADIGVGDYSNIQPTIYIFNAGYIGADPKVIGDDAGTWSTFTLSASSYMDHAVIPATQAFLVTAKSSGATLTLDYKKHVYDPAITTGRIDTFPTRAPRRNTMSIAPKRLKITVIKDNLKADELYIFQRSDFKTDSIDEGWDGYKMFGESYASEIYALSDTDMLAVNAVKNMEGVKIGFKAGVNNQEYTLSFDYEEQAEPLYLYDTDTETYTEITSDATYSFTTSDRKAHERFLLTRSNAPQIATGVEEIDTENVQRAQKFMQDQQILIRRGDKVYSIDGALVK